MSDGGRSEARSWTDSQHPYVCEISAHGINPFEPDCGDITFPGRMAVPLPIIDQHDLLRRDPKLAEDTSVGSRIRFAQPRAAGDERPVEKAG